MKGSSTIAVLLFGVAADAMLVLYASGCSNTVGTPQCTPGAAAECFCPGAARGGQVCGADGTFGVCDCGKGAGPDGGTDGGLLPDGGPLPDGGVPDGGSPADAQNAYLGLDVSVDKAITLGFDGFNSASTANISPQSADGGVSGTMTVTGQVDQGVSANKGMRLNDALSNYSDNGQITYNTDASALPALTINLKNIPTGTLDGSLNGSFMMSGGLSGQVSLALTFSGQIQAGPGNTVVRTPGTTHITGTATSSAGTYNVDVTR